MRTSPRRRTVAIVAVIALLLGAGAWWKLRGGHAPRRAPAAAGDDPWGDGAGEADRALVAKKRAARGDAPADASPASLAGTVRRAADGSGVAGAAVSITTRQFGGALFATIGGGGEQVIAVTDDAGAWHADAVPAGRLVVTAAAAGLVPGSVDVSVAPGASRRGVDLSLEAGGVALSGTVTDIGGGAIAEARVTVRPYGLSALDSSAAFVAITAADGRYAMTLPDGSWHATVTEADYADARRAFELRGQPLVLDFELTPGGVIRGQVIARDSGKPVPGARVTVSGGHGGAGDDDVAGLGGVAADDAGNFTLRGLASGTLSLRATGRGYASSAPTEVELGIGEQVAGIRVEVDRAYTISGFVVREGGAGEGIGGVRVGVFSIAQETGMFAPQPSADDGYFEILGVRPASYMIAALGADVMLEIGHSIRVVDRDLTDVLVKMKTGATLSGRVSPAAVAHLSLSIDPSKVGLGNMFDVAKAALVRGDSDATGAFALKGAPPGAFTLVAQTGDGATGELEVTVTASDQRGLVVPLEERGAISGKVVDPRGAPVGGVTVEARSLSARAMRLSMMQGPSETITGADGRFRVAGVDAGEVTLTVSDEDGPLAWADAAHASAPHMPITRTVTGADEVTGVVLTVEARDGVIRGLVLGPDRAPAADVWVTARAGMSPWAERMRGARRDDGDDGGGVHVDVEVKDDDDAPAAPGGPVPDTSLIGPGRTALTGPDGRFTISRLRRGDYGVVAEATTGGLRAQRTGVKTGDSVTLTLARMGSLAGTVTQGGAPVAGYDLRCHGPDGTHRRHVDAADGAYRFDRLPPGTYRCDVSGDSGSGSGSATVASDEARLDLAITGWASVTGVVVDADGQPLAGLKVLAMGGDEELGGAITEILSGGGPTTDAAGRFEIQRLAAGKGKLLVFPASSIAPLVDQEITLVAGQRLDVGKVTVKPDAEPATPTPPAP